MRLGAGVRYLGVAVVAVLALALVVFLSTVVVLIYFARSQAKSAETSRKDAAEMVSQLLRAQTEMQDRLAQRDAEYRDKELALREAAEERQREQLHLEQERADRSHELQSRALRMQEDLSELERAGRKEKIEQMRMQTRRMVPAGKLDVFASAFGGSLPTPAEGP